MAASLDLEAVDRIRYFVPENPRREVSVDLGEVVQGTTLAYEPCVYRLRLEGDEATFSLGLTKQRALVLRTQKDGQVVGHTLVYRADVLALGDDLAQRVLDKITSLQERS